MDDTEDKVLEAIYKIETILKEMSKKNKMNTIAPGVMILLEQDDKDIDNFNVSMFDYNKKEGILDEDYPVCTIIACGLLSILELDTDFVFTEGLEHLHKKYEEEMRKSRQGEVINFNNYRQKKCAKDLNENLTSQTRYTTDRQEKGDDDYDA